MNIKQMKSMISKFRSADLSVVKDADMRAKAQKLQAKQAGFTLLELLVVVAILAIIAGAVISSLDGQEELAAQKTTVHTMAALEEGFQVYRVSEQRRLPEELDSLLCSDGVAGAAGTFTLTPATLDGSTVRKLSNNDSASNVARVDGGMTGDLYDKLGVMVVNDDDVLDGLEDEGLTSLRYVNDTICNGTADETLFAAADGFDEDVTEPALVDVAKPSLLFRDPIVEDDDWEFGAGAVVDLTARAAGETVPMAYFAEPAELGLEEEAVVAVFGIGPDAGIIGPIMARAPQDGNAGPDKYSNFSVAIKIGECPTGEEIGTDDGATTCLPSTWEETDDIEVVAILDGGGDAYDDEIAEAQGNEEE
jgi:prepilin-type N-terminal cleavage/methylation domain-containing protein